MKDGEHNFAIVVLFVYIVFYLFLVVIPTRFIVDKLYLDALGITYHNLNSKTQFLCVLKNEQSDG